MAFLNIISLAHSLRGINTDLVAFLVAFLLIFSLALFIILCLANLVSNSMAFLLLFSLGDRLLDILAFHLRGVIALFLQLNSALVSSYSLVHGLLYGVALLLLLSVAFLINFSPALFIILSVALLVVLGYTLLFGNIFAHHLWHMMRPLNLLGRAFSVSLLMALLLMICVAFFTINIINLCDIFSVALLIIMSNTMSVLYSHSIGLLHSFTLLTRLIPAFILVHGFAGLRNTRIASEG